MATKATRLHAMLLPIGLLLATLPCAQAQDAITLTTLYSFSGSTGAGPSTLVQGSNGNFYGTTVSGGGNGDGTVFEITQPGILITLHDFNGDDGSEACALVQGSDGNFYGTTYQGGANGDGTVYQITPAGVFTTLHSFNGNDGANPEASLLQGSDGNFYGTTSNTVFVIGPSGEFATLHTFNGSDGSLPVGALVQGIDGNFYGTTRYGGATPVDGTIFQMTPSGEVTTLYSFSLMDNGGVFPTEG